MSLLTFALILALGKSDPTNPDWNYDNGGSDWDAKLYPHCTSAYAVESPVDYSYDWSTLGGYFLYDWCDDGFSFLPDATKA